MKHLVLFVHDNAESRPLYRAALAPVDGVEMVSIYCGGYSQAYVDAARSMRGSGRGRLLPQVVARYARVPQLGAYGTVSVISFSAGYALVRELLQHPDDRAAIGAVVAIDSIHAGFDPDRTAMDAQCAPFVELARRAKAGGALFALGHTDVRTPQTGPKAFASTTQTAAEIVRLADGTGGDFVAEAFDTEKDDTREHVAALMSWGPAFAARALVPYLGGVLPAEPEPEEWPEPDAPDPDPNPEAEPDSLGARCVAWCEAERAAGVQEEPLGSNHSDRIEWYAEPAYRRETGALLRLKALPWCAVAQCAAQRECLAPGEAGAHGYYASGVELEESARTVGTWRGPDYRPRVGDLAILLRQGVSDPATAGWERHVVRVRTVGASECTTIGGNENNRWGVSALRLDDARIVGWIAYP